MRAPCVYVASTSGLHLPGTLTREEGPESSLVHGNRASGPPDVVHASCWDAPADRSLRRRRRGREVQEEEGDQGWISGSGMQQN